ncbi:phage capsid protein [Maridesulfovibrio sp.]|uniref:phage capsid protein n=1 Tax=Maridesulfovibrio sp. TaxID=2795000 RepID=UPI002A187177|nr:phage capsid protein [Maridesulfovibrio sp.]
MGKNDVSAAFTSEFEDGVHIIYSGQGGSKLRNTVRTKTNVTGKDVTFQKKGKGSAGKKTRNGDVPLMNPDHTPATATLGDWYAAELVDKLDEFKIQHDERKTSQVIAASALGGVIDGRIIGQAALTTNVIGDGATGFSKLKLQQGNKILNGNSVPQDGNRYAIVGPNQWEELMNIKEFASSDYSKELFPWLQYAEGKSWNGYTWVMLPDLPLVDGVRSCFLYHKTAIGLAEACDVQCDIDWVPLKAAHLVNSYISAGAVLIDGEGVVEIKCDDDAPLA